MNTTKILLHGDSITLILPNGEKLNVECTNDTIDVVLKDGQIVYSEEFDNEKWNRITPNPNGGHWKD